MTFLRRKIKAFFCSWPAFTANFNHKHSVNIRKTPRLCFTVSRQLSSLLANYHACSTSNQSFLLKMESSMQEYQRRSYCMISCNKNWNHLSSVKICQRKLLPNQDSLDGYLFRLPIYLIKKVSPLVWLNFETHLMLKTYWRILHQ